MATAAELRRLREEQSIFAPLYEAARQQQSELAAQGRRPVFGGLLSKEPTYGTDTLRYEGIGNMLAGLLSPAAKAVDAPISAYRGTIPQEDMISEALGVGGLAMLGGGAVGVPRGAVAANASKSAGLLTTAASEAQDMAKRILDLRAQGRASEVTDEMMAQADPQYMFANTPLPMDEASRMARAEAAGFGGDGLHGTHLGSFREMFDAFDKEKGQSSETYIAPNTQEGVELISQFNSADTGASMPVMHRENLLDTSGMSGAAIPREKKQAWNILGKTGDYSGLPHWSNFKAISSARDAGYDGIKLEERDWVNSTAIFEPRNISSRFARFDPEFAHLSNLSAANVSPIGGLLAQSGANQQSGPVAPNLIDEYLKSLQARR